MRSGEFTRNNCGSGQTGSVVTYTVAADTYFTNYKADSNALAEAQVASGGQAYANANATCSAGPARTQNSIHAILRVSSADNQDLIFVTAYADVPVNHVIAVDITVHNSNVSDDSTVTVYIYDGQVYSSEYFVMSIPSGEGVDVTVSVTYLDITSWGTMDYVIA
jgi:hypothetical protein